MDIDHRSSLPSLQSIELARVRIEKTRTLRAPCIILSVLVIPARVLTRNQMSSCGLNQRLTRFYEKFLILIPS